MSTPNGISEAVAAGVELALAKLADRPTPPTQRWVDARDCGAYIGVSVHTLARWRSDGNDSGPPWVRIGGLVRYDLRAVDRWLEDGAPQRVPQ